LQHNGSTGYGCKSTLFSESVCRPVFYCCQALQHKKQEGQSFLHGFTILILGVLSFYQRLPPCERGKHPGGVAYGVNKKPSLLKAFHRIFKFVDDGRKGTPGFHRKDSIGFRGYSDQIFNNSKMRYNRKIKRKSFCDSFVDTLRRDI